MYKNTIFIVLISVFGGLWGQKTTINVVNSTSSSVNIVATTLDGTTDTLFLRAHQQNTLEFPSTFSHLIVMAYYGSIEDKMPAITVVEANTSAILNRWKSIGKDAQGYEQMIPINSSEHRIAPHIMYKKIESKIIQIATPTRTNIGLYTIEVLSSTYGKNNNLIPSGSFLMITNKDFDHIRLKIMDPKATQLAIINQRKNKKP